MHAHVHARLFPGFIATEWVTDESHMWLTFTFEFIGFEVGEMQKTSGPNRKVPLIFV